MRESQDYIKRRDEKEDHRPTWLEHIDFLVDHVPQEITSDGRLNYAIEGGAAISLLSGYGRNTPSDIDILVFDSTLVDPLSQLNPRIFDIQTAQQWLSNRHMTYTEQGLKIFSQSYTAFNSKHVNSLYLLHPTFLALGKSYGYKGFEPRPKDLFDLLILNVNSHDLDRAMEALCYQGELQTNQTI